LDNGPEERSPLHVYLVKKLRQFLSQTFRQLV
jgi:hypothetical protein